MIRRVAVVLLGVLATAVSCSGSDDADVAFVPSSFADLTVEIDRILAAEGQGRVEWVIAGSSRLVRQLEDGAEADLLITADEETMRRAVDAGLVDTPLGVVARNRLVFAIAPGNPAAITDLTDLGRQDLLLGVCAPEVPCGRLAERVAEALDIDLATDTEEPNVRSLASKIAAGELDGGLVYATDAFAFDLDTVDDDRLAAFVTDYHAASVTGEPTAVPAFLRSDRGRALLRERGFLVP